MALLLDLDNTLFDSVTIYESTLKQLERNAKRFGFKNPDEFRQKYSSARTEAKRELPKKSTNQLRLLYFKKMSESLFGSIRAKWVLDLEAEYFRLFLHGIKDWKRKNGNEFGKILRLLREIQEQKDLILLTNENLRTQLLKLKVLLPNTLKYQLTTSEEVGEEKPSRRIFEKALSLDSRKSGQDYMIGDSLEGDIQGALDYGIEAIHIKGILSDSNRSDFVLEKRSHAAGSYWEAPDLRSALNLVLATDQGRVL
ncbi:HAD family hydrolase [Leptospira fletcheri]|uniref:HAD family hydrolase n=1 Tax=Leptospira fletcheri TaxID=2484981 RepID=A0A4R9GH66_9LEPT|nr:HAD family hydrolase [Leptospira fletcheri]TGK11681.1 HAD family hydrolase [Leptospira fletcheri]